MVWNLRKTLRTYVVGCMYLCLGLTGATFQAANATECFDCLSKTGEAWLARTCEWCTTKPVDEVCLLDHKECASLHDAPLPRCYECLQRFGTEGRETTCVSCTRTTGTTFIRCRLEFQQYLRLLQGCYDCVRRNNWDACETNCVLCYDQKL